MAGFKNNSWSSPVSNQPIDDTRDAQERYAKEADTDDDGEIKDWDGEDDENKCDDSGYYSDIDGAAKEPHPVPFHRVIDGSAKTSSDDLLGLLQQLHLTLCTETFMDGQPGSTLLPTADAPLTESTAASSTRVTLDPCRASSLAMSKYKAILPTPDASGGASGGQDPDGRVAKRRRANRPNACEKCRLKKARCDGKRPSCSQCERWGTSCVYSVDHLANVERELKQHRDILRLLMSLPEDEAAAAHRHLRSTSNLSDALSSIQGSMHGRHQPSSMQIAQAISPPTSSSLEFELTVRHPIAYPTLIPLDVPSLRLDPRLKPVQRSPQNLLVEGSSPSDSMSPSTPSSHATSNTQSFERAGPNQEQDTTGPHPGQFCDKRLHQLQIGYWTGVAIDNEVAASAISHYLQGNHPIFGFFDPDLFIDDLVHHRHQFCSAFLVNALLAHACQAYSVIDDGVGVLGQEFARDAAVLWRAERSSDTILNVASVLMLSVSAHLQRSDMASNDLLDDGRAMAERMKLFGVPHTPANAASFDSMDPNTKRAMAHTAWGAYSYLTLNTFWVPTNPIAFPPMFPVPGRNKEDTIDERLAVRWPRHFIPDYAGKTFQTLCELWTIMQEVVAVYFPERGDEDAASIRIPLAFVQGKYQKLLAFTDSLPPEMSSTNQEYMPDHVLAFHILVHVAIVHIFHPFINDPNNQQLPLASMQPPRAILRASVNQLQRLILISRLDHPRAHSLSVLSSAVVHVSNTMIRDAAIRKRTMRASGYNKGYNNRGGDDDPNWHFYFLVCLAACQDLGACFPVFEPVGKGLLAMAMRDGSMSAGEANKLVRALEGPKRDPSQGTFGSFVLDFDLEATKPGNGQVKDLAAQFEELSMHNEYTKGGDFVLEPSSIIDDKTVGMAVGVAICEPHLTAGEAADRGATMSFRAHQMTENNDWDAFTIIVPAGRAASWPILSGLSLAKLSHIGI
ncbi:hypothetical protein F66182_3745 [Fusarium sp. NRRL 66182]|nr:hypothetical protein F66182_3745 [Fusarium sp. NRRL 66182]